MVLVKSTQGKLKSQMPYLSQGTQKWISSLIWEDSVDMNYLPYLRKFCGSKRILYMLNLVHVQHTPFAFRGVITGLFTETLLLQKWKAVCRIAFGSFPLTKKSIEYIANNGIFNKMNFPHELTGRTSLM